VRNARRDYGKVSLSVSRAGCRTRGIGITGLGAGTRTPMGRSCSIWKQIVDEFPNAELVDGTSVLDRVRFVKSDEESHLTKSQEIIEKAVEAKVAHAKVGACTGKFGPK